MILLKIGAAITILIHLNEHSSLFYFLSVLPFVCFNVLYDSEKQSFVTLFFLTIRTIEAGMELVKAAKFVKNEHIFPSAFLAAPLSYSFRRPWPWYQIFRWSSSNGNNSETSQQKETFNSREDWEWSESSSSQDLYELC